MEWRHGPFDTGTISQLDPGQVLLVPLSLRISIHTFKHGYINPMHASIHELGHETFINFRPMPEVINCQDRIYYMHSCPPQQGCNKVTPCSVEL